MPNLLPFRKCVVNFCQLSGLVMQDRNVKLVCMQCSSQSGIFMYFDLPTFLVFRDIFGLTTFTFSLAAAKLLNLHELAAHFWNAYKYDN